jgi:hypothetical protein
MEQKRKIDKVIPGYSGHLPRRDIPDDKVKRVPKGDGHIPGYCGFVQSITAENLYGKSYGTTTFEVHQAELKTKEMLTGIKDTHLRLGNS